MIDAAALIPLVIVAITQMIKMASPKVTGWITILVAFVVAVVVSLLSLTLPADVIGIPRITVGAAIFNALVAIGITASFAKAGGGASGDNSTAYHP